ncbi:helix-turn-helix transcriptional regulator [Shewanella sp. UCD-KL12]|uniref:helix-turn-helix domain-containing protein n=1 Tax=Shewanella sp. UCD-KL12 TaxID=1917163 RepID=UPI0009712969|nr:helix-turn-helix transcriptional regulator [Shewanella sp. UCD-KL12]
MFDILLKEIRVKQSLSQSDAIESLRSLDEFEKLDKVTYSRWENGHTRPSEIKQISAIFQLSTIQLAKKLARTFTLKNENETKVIHNRFGSVGDRTLDNFYLSHRHLSKKVTYEKSHVNPLISEAYHNAWGNSYNEYNKIIEEVGICCYSITEFYLDKKHLVGHQIIYFTCINKLESIIKNIGNQFSPSNTSIKGSDYVAVLACSHSSSDVIFLQNILGVLEYCDKKKFKARYVYLRLYNTDLKVYAESLGGTVSTFGPLSSHGLTHFTKTYAWLGFLIPMTSLIRQSPVYESYI